MQVLLTSPTIEEACLSFETLLTDTCYYADDTDGSTDVAYTVSDALAAPIYQWIVQATASGLIGKAVILEPPETDGTLSWQRQLTAPKGETDDV